MTLEQLLDYIWVPIVLGATALWTRVHGQGTRISLLEQAHTNHEKQRDEDKELRDTQRKEILGKIDAHHNVLMHRLETLEERLLSK